jgi:transcriptional regulator with XRE-family HTH domain
MSTEFHERLAWARRQAGFTGSREAARAFGWNQNTYKSHETGVRAGTRPPEQTVVRKYARAFGVDFVWLLSGEGNPKRRNIVRVSGRIGKDAEILPELELAPDGLFEIEAPFNLPTDVMAFEVEGESLSPRYDSGDVIICWREGSLVDDMLGWEVVVLVSNGRRYLKRVLRGSKKGFYDLEGPNAQTIHDAKIEWAAGIAAVVRAGQWKRVEAIRGPSRAERPKRRGAEPAAARG